MHYLPRAKDIQAVPLKGQMFDKRILLSFTQDAVYFRNERLPWLD